MADQDDRKGSGPTARAPAGSSAEARRTPSWVTEDPFPPKVSVDPALEAEAAPLAAASSTSGPTPPSTGTSSPIATPPPLSDRVPAEPRERPPVGPRLLGLVWWGWLLAVAAVLVATFIVADLLNRDRFVIVCNAHKVQLERGRRLPWPFGHESVGGPEYKPLVAAAEPDGEREFDGEEDAGRAFLDILLVQVRSALASPGGSNLDEARQQLQQALLLTRTHQARRKEAEGLLADLSYREGRAGLARAENELRLALSRFQEAERLDAHRFDDLDDWIAHLEEMLRTIAPSPFSAAPRAGSVAGPSGDLSSHRPARSPASMPFGASPPSPSPPASPSPAGGPDAGSPPAGSGILM